MLLLSGALVLLGPLVGLVLVALAVLFWLCVALGLEKTGTLMVGLGMATAPMNQLALGSNAIAADACFAVGFLLLLPRIMVGRAQLTPAYTVGMIGIAATGVIASALAPQPGPSFLPLIALLVCIAGLPLGFAFWRPSMGTIQFLAWAYVVGQMVSVGDALVKGVYANNRYAGLTIHPNFFGDAGMIAFALLLFLFGATPPARRWLVLGAMGMVGAGILMSGSRADLLVVILLLVAVPLVERSPVAGYVIVSGAVLVVASASKLLALSGSGSALTRLHGDASTGFSNQAREEGLSLGWHEFLHHPILGNGFAGYYDIHNVYLEIAVATGIIGLAFWLLLMWSFVRKLFLGGPLHALGYVPLGYVALAMINPSLYVRAIWAGVALSVLVVAPRRERASVSPAPARHARQPSEV